MSIIPAETDKSGNERLTATAPEFVEMLEAGYSKEGKTPGPGKSSTPGEIRTHDLRIRNPMLYPAELRGLVFLIRFSAIKGIGFATPEYARDTRNGSSPDEMNCRARSMSTSKKPSKPRSDFP
jgi:hypothetical protein